MDSEAADPLRVARRSPEGGATSAEGAAWRGVDVVVSLISPGKMRIFMDVIGKHVIHGIFLRKIGIFMDFPKKKKIFCGVFHQFHLLCLTIACIFKEDVGIQFSCTGTNNRKVGCQENRAPAKCKIVGLVKKAGLLKQKQGSLKKPGFFLPNISSFFALARSYPMESI